MESCLSIMAFLLTVALFFGGALIAGLLLLAAPQLILAAPVVLFAALILLAIISIVVKTIELTLNLLFPEKDKLS